MWSLDSPVLYDLWGIRVKILPGFIKHLQVVVTQVLSVVNVEGLQDDGDVQVDHQQQGEEDVGGAEDDAHCRAHTVTSDGWAWVLDVRVTVWSCVQKGNQHSIPTSPGGDHKHTEDAVPKRLEIKHVVDRGLLLHVGKVKHAEDRVGEHDEEEEEANVEEGRKWHHKGQKQHPYPLGKAEEVEDPKNTSQSKQREETWRNEVLLYQVSNEHAWNMEKGKVTSIGLL